MDRLDDDDLPHPRLRALVGRPGGGDRPPPRRAGARLPPGGRAVLLRGPAEGGVRHRDAGPRHQHAGPDRGGGAVRQVPRLGHLGAHLGRVPAADRTGRPPGHRHRGPRLRPLVGGHALRPGGPHRGGPAPGPGLVVPPHLQPGREPGAAVVEGRGPRLLAASYGQWQAPPGSVSLAAQLDRRLAILEAAGLHRRLADDRGRARPWPRCTTSRTCWSPRPCGTGLFDGLDPASLAGVVSALTFEARRVGDDARSRASRHGGRAAGRSWTTLAAELRADERRVGLRRTRRPDPGLARAVMAWARGATLDSVLRETEVAPGDFVRNVRQLIDLVRQLAQVAPDPGHPGGRRAGRGAAPAGGGRGRRSGRSGGPRLTRRRRPSVIRACSPTPWRRSAPTRRTSSAATSPISTSRCSPWSTCPRWSRGRCSPGTPGRRRACAGCSSTSSSGTWTSPATPRSTPPSG